MNKKYLLFGGFVPVVLILLFQFIIITFGIKLSVYNPYYHFVNYIFHPFLFVYNILGILIIGAIIGYFYGKIKNRNKV